MDVDYGEDEGAKPRRVKGRGGEDDDRYAGKAGTFERLPHDDDDAGPARSIEGWVVIVSGVHEEAQEDDVFEAFADRCYGDDGSLVHRSQPGAVHNRERMLAQVQQLRQDSTVTTLSGHIIPLQVDTLCVHGDNPESVGSIEAIRALVNGG